MTGYPRASARVSAQLRAKSVVISRLSKASCGSLPSGPPTSTSAWLARIATSAISLASEPGVADMSLCARLLSCSGSRVIVRGPGRTVMPETLPKRREHEPSGRLISRQLCAIALSRLIIRCGPSNMLKCVIAKSRLRLSLTNGSPHEPSMHTGRHHWPADCFFYGYLWAWRAASNSRHAGPAGYKPGLQHWYRSVTLVQLVTYNAKLRKLD